VLLTSVGSAVKSLAIRAKQRRKPRRKESTINFIMKYKRPIVLLEQGYKGSHVRKICNLNKNTITKIKKFIQPQLQEI